MSQQELLGKVVLGLEVSGCQYMLTGSFASSMQGEPRLSHDIDVVVVIPSDAIPALVACFPSPDFYLEEESMRDAIETRSMFSLLHTAEGDKVDFWMLTDEPFDISRFRRKRKESALGIQLFVSSPEDTILAKLRWAKMAGGSEKQFLDALRVYEVQRDTLDGEYLQKWVSSLDVEEYWTRLLRESSR